MTEPTMTVDEARTADKWWVRTRVDHVSNRSQACLYRGKQDLTWPFHVEFCADDDTGEQVYEQMVRVAATPSDRPGQLRHADDPDAQAGDGYPREHVETTKQ